MHVVALLASNFRPIALAADTPSILTHLLFLWAVGMQKPSKLETNAPTPVEKRRRCASPDGGDEEPLRAMASMQRRNQARGQRVEANPVLTIRIDHLTLPLAAGVSGAHG